MTARARARAVRLAWLQSLVAALIAGASTGLTSGGTAIVIAPSMFNMDNAVQLTNVLKLMAASALSGAITGVALFLKRSPWPGVQLPQEPALPAPTPEPTPTPAPAAPADEREAP